MKPESACGRGARSLGLLLFLSAGAANADVLYSQDFEALPLEPFVSATECCGDGTDWTDALPDGWVRDNTTTPEGGPVEFYGFHLMDKISWINTAANQDRSEWADGVGTVMVADPDEYDDGPGWDGIEPDLFNCFVTLPAIKLDGVPENSVKLKFNSSFRPYDAMTATVEVSFDGGASFENILTYDTANSGGDSSLDRVNEAVSIDVSNPSQGTAIFRFGSTTAGNDWWWALDDIVVEGGAGGGCYPDFTGDGTLDLFDFLSYVNAFNAGDDKADCDKNGGLDLFDFLCFVNAFNAGC